MACSSPAITSTSSGCSPSRGRFFRAEESRTPRDTPGRCAQPRCVAPPIRRRSSDCRPRHRIERPALHGHRRRTAALRGYEPRGHGRLLRAGDDAWRDVAGNGPASEAAAARVQDPRPAEARRHAARGGRGASSRRGGAPPAGSRLRGAIGPGAAASSPCFPKRRPASPAAGPGAVMFIFSSVIGRRRGASRDRVRQRGDGAAGARDDPAEGNRGQARDGRVEAARRPSVVDGVRAAGGSRRGARTADRAVGRGALSPLPAGRRAGLRFDARLPHPALQHRRVALDRRLLRAGAGAPDDAAGSQRGVEGHGARRPGSRIPVRPSRRSRGDPGRAVARAHDWGCADAPECSRRPDGGSRLPS